MTAYVCCLQTPFHVDLLATAFKPSDAFVHAASLNQLEVVKKWCDRVCSMATPSTHEQRLTINCTLRIDVSSYVLPTQDRSKP